MRKLAALPAAALVAAALAPMPAAARTVAARPIAVADIVAGLEACRAAATPSGFDAARLGAAGYAEGKWFDKSRRIAQSDLWVRINAADVALVLDKKATSCAVIAQIGSAADWIALNTALNRALNVSPSATVMGRTTWTLPTGTVDLQAVGSREVPGVRATVTSVSQEPK